MGSIGHGPRPGGVPDGQRHPCEVSGPRSEEHFAWKWMAPVFCFIFSMRRMRRSSSGWHVRHIVFINILTILTIVNGILFLLYVLLFSLLQGAIRTDFRLVAPALSVVCDSV